MKTMTAKSHRTALVKTLLGGAAVATVILTIPAGPFASAAADPCAANEVAKTVGSVAQSIADYLDTHPETNQTMTTMLQQQAGPQSVTSLASYFTTNPQVAADLQSLAQPLTGLSTQCKLPITLPLALGPMQPTQTATELANSPNTATNPTTQPEPQPPQPHHHPMTAPLPSNTT